MKRKGLLIATIIFFLLVNTTYYWEGKMGMFAMVIFLLLVIYFIVLTTLLLRQAFFAIKEKIENKQRVILIGLMIAVLTTSIAFPGGIINFEKLESESLLIAQREGAANCMTTLKLKANNKFVERIVCFGITETTGEYKIVGDTVYFGSISLGRHKKEFYQFAVIKNNNNKGKHLGSLVIFENQADTIGYPLLINKNELKK